MSPYAFSPAIVSVILGASRWPEWPELDNAAFAKSHDGFVEYLRDVLHLPDTRILDLFDARDSPGDLVGRMQAFLAQCDDVETTDFVVYYVGHGDDMVGTDDYALLTAYASKDRPDSSAFKASFLFEATRAANERIRAHLIVDACFSAAASAAFRRPMGSSGVSILASASSADKSYAPTGTEPTHFTRALLSVLRRGKPQSPRELSLTNLHDLVEDELRALGMDDLTYPELHNPQQRKGIVAAMGIFPNLAHYDSVVATDLPRALARSAWGRFTPQRLHCVVVTSEAALGETPADRLDVLVSNVFAGSTADSVWHAFRDAATRHPLVDGSGPRELPQDYAYSSVALAAFGVLDAYDSAPSLNLAARLIIEADLALFDVTGFEPGIMLLLGIRAATRRGVTLVSHGRLSDGRPWRAGEPLDRPFNLSDLALASHTPPDDPTGPDQREERMERRIVAGFNRLRSSPLYKDLPVYDALRALGAGADARRTIPLEKEILVLCSYEKRFYGNWRHLRSRLQLALAKSKTRGTVVRLQDVEDPQLVSLALYDRIRRCTGCIADWTRSSPSTFFELGVRIAASQWGVVQIVSRSWIAKAQTTASKGQFDLMLTLLDPVQYDDTEDEAIGATIAARLIEIRNRPERQGGYGLRRVAAEALARVDAAMPDVVAALSEEADALHHPNQLSQNVPRALYYEIPAIKQDQERAALERRIAAWLYLDRRLAAGSRPPDDPLRRAWIGIGRQAATGLFDSPAAADQRLFLEISEEWESEPDDDLDDVVATATLVRQRGDVLRGQDQPETAEAEYRAGIRRIDHFRAARAAAGVALPAADQAELLGIRGGLFRRCGQLRDALASYEDGAKWEQNANLASTYNRTNAIKLGLRVGDRLAALRATIDDTEAALTRRLQQDERAADDAWAWADLGDVRLLQGDVAGAEEAYAAFTRKATSSSPASTLSALEQVAEDLDHHGDPAARDVRAAVERVRPLLSR
jgi:tetratricopeptide (TPR) repeat protein